MSESTNRNSTDFVLGAKSPGRGPVLIVDDDAVHSKILVRLLTSRHFEVITASDGVDGLDLARTKHPDIIVTDWMMPRMNGMELCEAVRADPEIQATYIILISNHHDVDEKIQGLARGADDYVAKTITNDELVARLEAGMRIRSLQRALVQQASVDGLTELWNRTHFFRRFTEELERSRRYGQQVTLTMIDLDGLKQANDTFGHLAGDAMIRHVAAFLRQHCRATDIIGRWGGDEFAVLFVATDVDQASATMSRLEESLRTSPVLFEGREIPCAFSYGITACDPERSIDPDIFVRDADRHLYEMKRLHHIEQ